MKKQDRSSILDVLIKGNWYKAQISLGEMCLSVSLVDSYLDSFLNPNSSNQDINDVRRVRVVKTADDNNFGISIKGGKENNMPIFISKIFPNTPADQTGQLNIGDSILAVNGESLVDATHEDAVTALKRAGNKAELEVKYLREVMLQYKKASLLPEIGWNLINKSTTILNQNNQSNQNNHNYQINNQDIRNSQRSLNDSSFFLPKTASITCSNGTNKLKSDIRVVPLLLCHLFKLNFSPQQSSEQNVLNDPTTITLFSPDLKNSLSLRCPDEISAYTWANAITNEIHETTLNALAEANINLSPILNSTTIKYMGWLSEKINSSYRPTFLVLTNKELLFFDSVPYTVQNWKVPVSRYQLEHCRLVKVDEKAPNLSRLNNTNGSNGHSKEQSKLNSFALRIGTLSGLITVELSSDSNQLLSIWAKKIIESSCNAAVSLHESSFSCIFEGKKCELIINIDNGFTVKDSSTKEVILKKDFSELINSSDDNARFVTLQFKNEKISRDFDLLQHPKPLIFLLHTFLFVKMSKLGYI